MSTAEHHAEHRDKNQDKNRDEKRDRAQRSEPLLPQHTVDDTDAGWGERHASNDERLLAERPPHWG